MGIQQAERSELISINIIVKLQVIICLLVYSWLIFYDLEVHLVSNTIMSTDKYMSIYKKFCSGKLGMFFLGFVSFCLDQPKRL